jgi:hypothetical protein
MSTGGVVDESVRATVRSARSSHQRKRVTDIDAVADDTPAVQIHQFSCGRRKRFAAAADMPRRQAQGIARPWICQAGTASVTKCVARREADR